MATYTSMLLPPPTGWDDFEKIVLSALRIKWRSPNLVRHGRAGQAQHGVDIYGPDDLGLLVGVQCKLTASEISPDPERLILQAEGFRPLISSFFFATADSTDAKLQQVIRLISEARVGHERFPVGIFFWQDLTQDLAKDEQELRLHFPQLVVPAISQLPTETRPLALITMAYYGSSLAYFIELVFGEFGRMAHEDPQQFVALARTVDDCATVAVAPPLRDRISQHLQVLVGKAMEAFQTPAETGLLWQKVVSLAQEAQNYIANVEFNLAGRDLWAFRVGSVLGRWNRVVSSEDPFPSQIAHGLTDRLQELFDGKVPETIRKEIEAFDPETISCIYVPDRVLSLAKEAGRHTREHRAD